MAYSRSYRATKARECSIDVRACANEVFGLATIRANYGNEVRTYDLERTLCDIVRGQRIVDVQAVNPAMRRCARSEAGEVQKPLGYAQALGVERKIRNHLKALL